MSGYYGSADARAELGGKMAKGFQEDAHFQRNCKTKSGETAVPASTVAPAAPAKSWVKKRNTIATNPVFGINAGNAFHQ